MKKEADHRRSTALYTMSSQPPSMPRRCHKAKASLAGICAEQMLPKLCPMCVMCMKGFQSACHYVRTSHKGEGTAALLSEFKLTLVMMLTLHFSRSMQ